MQKMGYVEQINDPIQAFVLFKHGKVIPFSFSWNGKSYKVKGTNMIHTAKDGEATLYFFSVSSESGTYKLQFNTQTMIWSLDEVFFEG